MAALRPVVVILTALAWGRSVHQMDFQGERDESVETASNYAADGSDAGTWDGLDSLLSFRWKYFAKGHAQLGRCAATRTEAGRLTDRSFPTCAQTEAQSQIAAGYELPFSR
jgi:hypothetical protein